VARIRASEVGTITLIVAADQATKALIRSRFSLYDTTEIIPGLLNLTRVHNTGAAFGMLNATDQPAKTLLLGVVAAAALIGLGLYAAALPREQWLTRAGLTLIIAGAAGNLIDRIALGYVVDFVDVVFGSWHFWAFNVADSAITVGVVLMILDMFGLGRRRVSGTL
jgi:signal peptidase II